MVETGITEKRFCVTLGVWGYLVTIDTGVRQTSNLWFICRLILIVMVQLLTLKYTGQRLEFKVPDLKAKRLIVESSTK